MTPAQSPRDQAKVPPPMRLTPYICPICGDARGDARGYGVPFCVNHGTGTAMVEAQIKGAKS